MKLFNRLILSAFLGFIIFFALPVSAQVRVIDRGNCGFFGQRCEGTETFNISIRDYIDDVVVVFRTLLGTIAAAFLVYAGYKYVMSFGSEEASATAKRQISYALIGLFVAFATGPIMALVQETPDAEPLQNEIDPIINALIALLGTVATGFLVYAGFKYVTSQGDESAAATAKRQIVYAILGIFVAGATGAIKAIAGASTGDLNFRILAVVNSLMALLGTVATGFLVYAGFKYVTSQGDESAAATAKRQIVYAILGIFVGGSSYAISSILSIADANTVELMRRVNAVVVAFEYLIGIVATFFLVISGVMYITSTGDEQRSEQAKRQIIYAILGILVAGTARLITDTASLFVDADPANDVSAIVNTIRGVATGFLALVATVAAIYMLIAGVMYITSYGDEERARRAKNQVLYAAVGLIVIVLSGVLVNFVIAAVN